MKLLGWLVWLVTLAQLELQVQRVLQGLRGRQALKVTLVIQPMKLLLQTDLLEQSPIG